MKDVVLCTLQGPMAVENAKTRNYTNYGSAVWDAIFSSPEYIEMKMNKSFYIGLDHPEEATRSSICTLLREVAGIVRQVDRRPDGVVWVTVDILDTPFGRVAYTLARYGSFLGISTRMNGDLDPQGNVIPSSVEFLGADLVSVPSQELGRLKMVLNESVRSSKELPQAYLTKALEYVKENQPTNSKLMESIKKDIKEEMDMVNNRKVPKILLENKKVNPAAFAKGLYESKTHQITVDGMMRNMRTGKDSTIKNIRRLQEGKLLEMYDDQGAMAIFEMVDAEPEAGVSVVDEFGNVIEEGCDEFGNPIMEGEDPEDDFEEVLTEGQFQDETIELVQEAMSVDTPEVENVVVGEATEVLVESKKGIRVAVSGLHGGMRVTDANGNLLEIAKMEKGDKLVESVKTLINYHEKLLEKKSRRPRLEGLDRSEVNEFINDILKNREMSMMRKSPSSWSDKEAKEFAFYVRDMAEGSMSGLDSYDYLEMMLDNAQVKSAIKSTFNKDPYVWVDEMRESGVFGLLEAKKSRRGRLEGKKLMEGVTVYSERTNKDIPIRVGSIFQMDWDGPAIVKVTKIIDQDEIEVARCDKNGKIIPGAENIGPMYPPEEFIDKMIKF